MSAFAIFPTVQHIVISSRVDSSDLKGAVQMRTTMMLEPKYGESGR